MLFHLHFHLIYLFYFAQQEMKELLKSRAVMAHLPAPEYATDLETSLLDLNVLLATPSYIEIVLLLIKEIIFVSSSSSNKHSCSSKINQGFSRLIKGMDGCFPTAYGTGRQPTFSNLHSHLNPFATSGAYMRQLFHCLQ